jgi:hypothetical protein
MNQTPRRRTALAALLLIACAACSDDSDDTLLKDGGGGHAEEHDASTQPADVDAAQGNGADAAVSSGACDSRATCCAKVCEMIARTECKDDEPEDGCVSTCMDDTFPDCKTQKDALTECRAALSQLKFKCEADSTLTKIDGCQAEQEAFATCATGG